MDVSLSPIKSVRLGLSFQYNDATDAAKKSVSPTQCRHINLLIMDIPNIQAACIDIRQED
jgi:hypothetical protein